MTDRIAPLASISINCTDPDELATFYRQLLGLEEAFAAPDRSVIALSGAGPMVTLMRVDGYVPPAWPSDGGQLHLDLAAEHLDADVAAAVALGAREADFQPAPDVWRVMLDPAGHPFCLSTSRPD